MSEFWEPLTDNEKNDLKEGDEVCICLNDLFGDGIGSYPILIFQQWGSHNLTGSKVAFCLGIGNSHILHRFSNVAETYSAARVGRRPVPTIDEMMIGEGTYEV
jgi:hypothetical protein